MNLIIFVYLSFRKTTLMSRSQNHFYQLLFLSWIRVLKKAHKNVNVGKLCGNQLLTGGDRIIAIWNLVRGEKVNSLELEMKVMCLDMAGNIVVSGGYHVTSGDKTDVGCICIWDLNTGEHHMLYGHDSAVSDIKFRDNKLWTSSYDGTLKIWDSSKCITTLGNGIGLTCVDVSSTHVVSGSSGRNIEIWDRHTGEHKHTLSQHTYAITCVTIQQSFILSASFDKTIKLWDTTSAQCLKTFQGHTEPVECIDVEGDILVSGSLDKCIKIWDLSSGQCCHTLRGHTSSVVHVELMGNVIVSVSFDGTIKLWTVQ